MLKIRELDKTESNIVDDVVSIHLDTFKGFFLTFMGKGFLGQMYRSYCEHNSSGILVAFNDNDDPIGFLSYSRDMSGLYKHMIKKRLLSFAVYSFGAFLRNPKTFFRIIRAFLKPSESKSVDRYIELSSIGVKPDTVSRGVGTALINELKALTDFSLFKYIKLSTDAVDNDGANYFYKKNGFRLVRSYKTREGRLMNEYIFGVMS